MLFIPFVGQHGIQKDLYKSISDLDKKLRWIEQDDKEFKSLWEEREELFEWRNWIMVNMGWYDFSSKTKEDCVVSSYDWYDG